MAAAAVAVPRAPRPGGGPAGDSPTAPGEGAEWAYQEWSRGAAGQGEHRPAARTFGMAEENAQPWGRRAGGAAGAATGSPAAAAGRATARPIAEPLGGDDAGPSAPRLAAGVQAPSAPIGQPLAPREAAGHEPGGERVVEMGQREAGQRVPSLLAEHARLAERGREQELRVRLRPPDLGEIRVNFRSRDGVLRGAIQVERLEVREWVEARLAGWREELSGAGLKVDRLEVSLMPREGGGDHGLPGRGDMPQPQDAAPSSPKGASPGPAPQAGGPSLGVNLAGRRGGIDYFA
ncbi:MAG: flagellar hook-length control protein FliK [Candidatus Brocadiia bacterium]